MPTVRGEPKPGERVRLPELSRARTSRSGTAWPGSLGACGENSVPYIYRGVFRAKSLQVFWESWIFLSQGVIFRAGESDGRYGKTTERTTARR